MNRQLKTPQDVLDHWRRNGFSDAWLLETLEARTLESSKEPPKWLVDLVAKLGAVTSEVRTHMDKEGGFVTVLCPNAATVMDVHAMLAGRFDIVVSLQNQDIV